MAFKYVSTTGSNAANGNTTITPYQTTSYAISQMVAGDTLFLKRGDVFPLMDYVSLRINIDAYGTGALPEFSGFVTATGWVNEGSGVWSYTDAGLPSILNVITVDGVFQPRVRFAKNGYMTIQSHTGTNYGTITNNTIPNSPSLVGAEIVIRKRRWVIDRALITGHASGGVLTYANLDSRHGLTYTPIDGYGFFIQNHNSVMTEVGDWRYDNAAKKVYMYFGAGNPTSYVVKIAKAARAFHTGDIGGAATYSNFHVTGCNQYGWSAIAASATLTGVKFSFIGEYALYTTNINSIAFNTCIFENMPNSCIAGDGGCHNWSVTGCTFDKVYHWAGAGGSNDGTKGNIVAIFGDNTNCQYNTATNLGYEGIYLRGNGFICDNNFFDTHGYIKDDGGAIYTFEGTQITNSTRRKIRNNIIRNGIGNILGTNETELKAMGIYIDEKASQVDIQGNFVELGSKGIFLHNAYDIDIDTSNTFYNNLEQIRIRTFDVAAPSANIDIANNVMVGDKLIVHDSAGSSNTAWGTSDNNKFYSNSVTPFTTRISEGAFVNQSFAGWKTATSKDAASTLVTYTGEQTKYNATSAPVAVPLTGSWVGPDGTIYSGSVTLAAYKGIFLLPSSGTTKILVYNGKALVYNGKALVTG